jgi:hypothetical protein
MGFAKMGRVEISGRIEIHPDYEWSLRLWCFYLFSSSAGTIHKLHRFQSDAIKKKSLSLEKDFCYLFCSHAHAGLLFIPYNYEV